MRGHDLDATDATHHETIDQFTTTIVRGRAIVSVSGDIDILTAPALRATFAEAIDRAETGVIADLSLVSFIDACGLGVLAGASGRARHLPAGLRLSGVPEHVHRLLRLTGLDSSLPAFPYVPRPARTGASLTAAVATPVLAAHGADLAMAKMTIIRQPRYPALGIGRLTGQDPQVATEAVIRGQFSFREPLVNGDELDGRWFRPYPSQD
jgi:anti-sigma B factor antagonist